METIIILLLFLSVAINPAVAGRLLLGWFALDDEHNIRHLKIIQVFNAVASIALLVLVLILFNQ